MGKKIKASFACPYHPCHQRDDTRCVDRRLALTLLLPGPASVWCTQVLLLTPGVAVRARAPLFSHSFWCRANCGPLRNAHASPPQWVHRNRRISMASQHTTDYPIHPLTQPPTCWMSLLVAAFFFFCPGTKGVDKDNVLGSFWFCMANTIIKINGWGVWRWKYLFTMAWERNNNGTSTLNLLWQSKDGLWCVSGFIGFEWIQHRENINFQET